MSGERYLIVVPHGGASDAWRGRLSETGRDLGLVLTAGRRFFLLSDAPPLPVGKTQPPGGAIVGKIFARTGGDALSQLPDVDARRALATSGASLIGSHWGDYVAIIDHEGAPTILRAPFGDLPCFVRRTSEATLLASDIALLESMSGRPVIDWHAVALQLIAPDIRRRQTCLAEIEELACGDRVTVGPALNYQTIWSPWDFVGPAHRCDDRLAASELLRSALLGTIAAQTSDRRPNLLLLSGGVDSSVAAAALAAAGRDTIALTMVTRDAAGDERDHARSVAGHCGIPLLEVVREPAMVDITRSEGCALPYPTETGFSQATRTAAAEALGSEDRRVFHGGGGDQIFCSLQSAAPLADLVRAKGLDRRISALTLDLARLAQTTAGTVIRQALARLIAGRSDYRWRANLDCLMPAACAYEAEALVHPWLSPPVSVGSGTAGHVALMMSALGIVQSPAWRARPPWKAILLSQPVIETCLAVTPWLWFEHGRNRAVARHAVEDLLPPGHIWRPGKGAMASFMIEIFDANRARLRAMIGDGMLVREGIVDRDACLRILDQPPPIRGNGWARLLHFADVEAWAASW